MKELFTKVKNYFFSKDKIILLIDDFGNKLFIIKNKKIIKSKIINLNNLKQYDSFLRNYKNYNLSIIFNTSNCKLEHKNIPILHSIIIKNNITSFIKDFFTKDDIVGYTVYNKNIQSEENWDILFISTEYTPNLKKILTFLIQNYKFHFEKIVFLPFAIESIINFIKKKYNKKSSSKELEIFTFTINQNSLNIILKHKENILFIKKHILSKDQSIKYIEGIIEQEIEDILNNWKNYIEESKLKISLIFLVEEELKNLLEKSDFYRNNPLFLNPIIIKPETDSTESLIVENLSNKKTHATFHKEFNSLYKIEFINRIILKYFNILIILMMILLLVLQSQILYYKKKLNNLNSYHLINQAEHTKIKNKYLYIHNSLNLIDLYIFESLLQMPISIPFDLLEQFVRQLTPNLFLEGMKWHRLDIDNTILLPNPYIKIEIFLNFIIHNTTLDDAMKKLHTQIIKSTKLFNSIDTNIFYDKIVNLNNRILIPISITMTQKKD